MGATVTLKVAIKASLRSKKTLKHRFSGYFSEAKTEESDQRNWSKCNKIGMSIPFTARKVLEVGACFSLKVPAKLYL